MSIVKFYKKRTRKMKLDNYTIEGLWKVLGILDFLAEFYDWDSDEFEFLMDLCGQIEDALRGVRR